MVWLPQGTLVHRKRLAISNMLGLGLLLWPKALHDTMPCLYLLSEIKFQPLCGRLWEMFIVQSMMNPPHTTRKQSPFLGFLIFSHATQCPLHLAWLNLKIIGHMYHYMVQAESESSSTSSTFPCFFHCWSRLKPQNRFPNLSAAKVPHAHRLLSLVFMTHDVKPEKVELPKQKQQHNWIGP